MNTPTRKTHTSRIAAIAFAGVFMICAVVIGVVLVMNNNDDAVDASTINLTVTNSAVHPPALNATIRMENNGGVHQHNSWANASWGTWTFGVVNTVTNNVQQVSGLSVSRTTELFDTQHIIMGSTWHERNNIRFNFQAVLPAHHRIYRASSFTFGGARPTTGLTYLGDTADFGATRIFSGSLEVIRHTPLGWYTRIPSITQTQHPSGGTVTHIPRNYYGDPTVSSSVSANLGNQMLLLVPIANTVTFNTHGGSAVPAQGVLHNMPAIQPNPNPTLANHTFRHWSAAQNGATSWNFATLITGPTTINATNTLHAVWWVNPIITFNAQGGSPTPPQQRPAHGGVIVQPASPTLLNHTFRHWSETPGGATAWNFATTTTIDRTLHAVWWVNPTITFNTHGGTPTPAQQRPAHGGRIIEPAQNPTLSGHNFRHWSATPNGATPWNFDHTVTTNQTLHAVWDIMIWRTINFRIGNPLNNTAVTFAFSVEYLSTLYFRNHIPIEQDLVFLGWATSAENARNKVIVHTSAGTMQVVNNTTLYAVWDINWDHFPGLDGHNTMMLNFTGGINPDQSGGIVRVERQFWSWDPLSRWLPSTEYMHAWEAEREPSPQHRRTFLGWFDNSAGTGTPRTSIPSTHSGPIEFWAIWTI